MSDPAPRAGFALVATIGVLIVLVVGGALALAAAGGGLPSESSPVGDPSDVASPAPPPATGAVEPEPVSFGDGTYLNGYEYLRGVNVYSLIFAGKGPDLADVGEPQSSYDYLASRGVSIVRLAVPWQRLQEIPEGGTAIDGLAQPIDLEYLEMVAEQVNRAAKAGIRTVFDLHNGCTYPWGAGEFIEGSVRCGDGITEEHVANLWTTIASRFKGDERVIAYDIFNEPRWSVGVDTYKHYAQVAVDAIRATGDDHTLWVEGILSDVRGRLAAIAPDGPWIHDPLEKTMYSEHFYVDEGGAHYSEIENPRVILERLRTFGEWCRAWSVRCSVGEVGWPSGGPGGVHSQEDADAWNELFEEFYDMADAYELDVTHFAASGSRQVGTLLTYVASRPGIPAVSGIDTALSQAEVFERHLSRPAE
ncbi:cellulase family glycosylhydrolase [Microbacterium sp. NPDC019599]|uniref:glycoside hydrolase family 5 protein n=1 Tax=Microbacterium sp. NPDC019599 TaxID=3154690 RepID=UPI00340BE2B5